MWALFFLAHSSHPGLGVEVIVPREGEDGEAESRPWGFHREALGSKKACAVPFFPTSKQRGL